MGWSPDHWNNSFLNNELGWGGNRVSCTCWPYLSAPIVSGQDQPLKSMRKPWRSGNKTVSRAQGMRSECGTASGDTSACRMAQLAGWNQLCGRQLVNPRTGASSRQVTSSPVVTRLQSFSRTSSPRSGKISVPHDVLPARYRDTTASRGSWISDWAHGSCWLAQLIPFCQSVFGCHSLTHPRLSFTNVPVRASFVSQTASWIVQLKFGLFWSSFEIQFSHTFTWA